MVHQTATQIVAGIPELLHLIIGELRSDFQSLNRLVCASTVLHQVSISYLWSGEHNNPLELALLLRLLPETLLDHYGAHKGDAAIKRAPRDSDWDRFRHYSLHTGSLTLRSDSTPLILFSTSHNDLLFPRLHLLFVDASSKYNHMSAEWMVLTGPSLRHLQVSGYTPYGHELKDNADVYISFYQHLLIHRANIQSLSLQDFPPSFDASLTTLRDAFRTTLQSLRHLQSFDCSSKTPLPNDILAALTTHLPLSNIVLSPLTDWPMVADNSPRFPSLRCVSLTCTETAGARFIQSLDSPGRLSSVHIRFSYEEHDSWYLFGSQPPYADAVQAFQPFSRFLPLLAHITDITLDCGWQLVAWEQINLLLGCRSLVHVKIGSSAPLIGLNDGAIEDMALSWPELEELKFTLRNYPPGCTEVTLHGLIPLAQFTPKLRALCIGLTTRVHDQSRTHILHQFRPIIDSPFCSLDLDGSEINIEGDTSTFPGPRRTAMIITTLWPSLCSKELFFAAERRSGRRDAWEAVFAYMKMREQSGEGVQVM